MCVCVLVRASLAACVGLSVLSLSLVVPVLAYSAFTSSLHRLLSTSSILQGLP